ncbi:CHAT domain-containing protein [Aerosakkonemataceae cyanobacterium BLCC-F50]|uniref:CHAT domain-containing protein n=1 Tax=Floridaenema flaviceps BLCC-F50 TaxID=3153642 RepID=A0ABV4XIR1_9CYAN
MSKLVVLKIGDGDFAEGFPVTLLIAEDGDRPLAEIIGKLPPAPEIPSLYSQWQSSYHSLGIGFRIKLEKATKKNFFENQFNQLIQELKYSINAWLNSEPFRFIREMLLTKLSSDETVRVIIQTKDARLRRLPWHLWDLFERYPKAEIALSAPMFDRVERSIQPKGRIRILAILGDRTGIDIESDRHFLQSIPNAEIVFLVEPQRQELNEQLWDESGWNMLFFAGHSTSEPDVNTGHIYLNPTETLTIIELKYALKRAIDRGLELAIFNSCDGLGLAQELAHLHIPQIIVMREPVPDLVAKEFLKYFLNSFSSGKSLYLAVREARERLQGLENLFPCASWLPVIYQNPAESPVTWQQMLNPIPEGSIQNFVTLLGVNSSYVQLSSWGNDISDQAPDLILYIKYEVSQNQPLLSFSLFQKGKPELKFSPVKLDGSLEIYANILHNKLTEIIEMTNPKRGVRHEVFTESTLITGRKLVPVKQPTRVSLNSVDKKLKKIGHKLWKELIPSELKTIYAQNREIWHNKTLFVISDEPFIPWEMVWPYDARNNWEDKEPWCISMRMTCWLRRDTQDNSQEVAPTQLSLNKLACLVPKDSGLQYAHQEQEFLRRLVSQHNLCDVSPAHSDLSEVLHLLENGHYNWFHIAAQNRELNPDILDDASAICLEDGEYLTLDDVLGLEIEKHIYNSRPAFFFNVSHSSRQAWGLTGLGGWPTRLLSAGAGLFLAPWWRISDDLALEFAKTFYQELLNGQTVAEAVRLSRLAIHRTGDPTWVAYRVYAHPNARVGLLIEPTSAECTAWELVKPTSAVR